MIVVADDFTGAAEIAALAQQRDWEAFVYRGRCVAPIPAEPGAIHVFDTDSRLLAPSQAVAAIESLPPASTASPVFKKTDSALRGNVLVELKALAGRLGSQRILFAPANPSAGRRIAQGRYTINGVPLHRTEFAQDPHHPARSDDPLVILGAEPSDNARCCQPGDEPPASGIVVCEASSIQDLDTWAGLLRPGDLLAGGRDFFDALLRALGSRPPSSNQLPNAPIQPAVILQGSRSPQAELLPSRLPKGSYARLFFHPDSHPDLIDQIARSTLDALQHAQLALISVLPGHYSAVDTPLRIQQCFARIAQRFSDSKRVAHILIEGGATSSCVLDALELERFSINRVWAPGVASLAALSQTPTPLFTTKPGSYSWPDNLLRALLSSEPAATLHPS